MLSTKCLQTKKYDIIDDDMDYKYLVKMPMDSVIDRKNPETFKEKDDKELKVGNSKEDYRETDLAKRIEKS